MDLLCVGDVMLDVRVDARALERGGDVHGRVLVEPGGTSANAAVWAAWDGAAAGVLAAVGRDIAGELLVSALGARGVECLVTFADSPPVPTGTMLVVHEAGERSMVVDRGANAALLPTDLPERLDAGAVLLSGYLLLQEPGNEAAAAVIDRARARWLAVEAASWPMIEAFGPGRFFDETTSASAVFANEREAEVLTGRAAGADAAAELGERYRLACVKRGADGAALCVDGRLLERAAEAVDDVDSTGAGDAFDGVLLGALARGAEPEDALARACHAGALVASGSRIWPEAP